MENKRMSELPVATVVNDEDYTVIVQDGINKRANREIFKQKDYNNLNNRPYINSTYVASLTPANELLQGTIQFHKISKTGKYGDLLDLPFIPTALTQLSNDGYFVQDQYYVHTDNNLTGGLVDKINSAIQNIKVNDTLLTPNDSQEVNIIVPINLTELTNDGYFVQDPNYVHTDNNFTTILKNNYDNLVSNVNQIVSSTNKLATMNDLVAIDSGYWIVIDLYKDILFDGVINVGEEIPTIGIYAVIEGTENLTINKYIDGISDNSNVPIKEGYFVFVNGTDTDIVYYIKENAWKKLGTDLGNYYNKRESDNRYVQKEANKGLSTNDFTNDYKKKIDNLSSGENTNLTSEEKEKLSGISPNANKVEASVINGNIKIDGTEVNVYTKTDLTKDEVIDALGYTPPTTDTTYNVATTRKDGLMSYNMVNKLNSISVGANNVLFTCDLTSGTKIGTITIDDTPKDIYAPNYDVATTNKNGLLSSTDKQKIDGIESTYLKKTENAVSATKLKTARKINGVAFDGTADINIDIAKEFYYSTIPMSSSLAEIYARQKLVEFWGSDYYLDGMQYAGDEAIGTLAYIYIIRDGNTYMKGYLKINACTKSDVEYEAGYPSDTRDSQTRLYINNWADTVEISVLGFPQDCKKIEFSFQQSRYGRSWETGDNGNISYNKSFPFTSSGNYSAAIRITFNDGQIVEYSKYDWFYWSGGGLACFTGDTLINTENGLRAIKELKINDKVYSKNKEGIVELKEIVKTFSHITERIYEIDIGSNIIKASWSHPFYVVNKGKVLTRNLKVGDKLQNVKNNVIEIKKIEILEQPTEVFEIKVQNNLNYFVGTNNILVGCEDLDKLKGEKVHGVNKQ